MMVVLALVTACSSQPLTGNMTGTGGVTTGAGATGGSAVGATGGSSGGATVATCLDIANQYQQGVAFAQACDVGASSPCSQLVIGALSVCGSCPTYVTDSSKLDLLRQRWDAGNCYSVLPPIPCPALLCAKPASAVCAAADGGTRGTCAPVYDGTGGGSGSPTDAGFGVSCDALVAKYAAAMAVAKSCALGGTDQCAQSTSPSLLPCRSDCVQFVNDTTELDAIRQVWEQLGCSNTTGGACPPASACLPGGGPACVATDAGGPTCGTAVLLR